MSPESWNKWVDTGELQIKDIKLIVSKIQRGQQLTQQEMAVYPSHADIIETMLKRG